MRLDAQELERALDARLAERAETPDVGPADAHGGRPHAQRLDDVGAAAETGIDQDRHASVHGLDDLRQRVDGGAAGILAARAVIGDDDRVDAVVGGEHGILPGQDALDDDLHLGDVAQALEEVPGHGRGLGVRRPDRSSPWYIARVRMLDCRLLRSWQPLQSRVSLARRRNRVSWLRPPLRSTVTATARQPAFSARLTMACATSHLLVA